MSGSVVAGLLIAFLSSAFNNASYFIQHRALDDGPEIAIIKPIASLKGLLGRPVWLLGGLSGLLGMILYVVALSLAPLSLVQVFLAGGLILTVPLSVWITKHAPTGGELRGAALMTAALVLLGVGSAADGPTNHFDPVVLAVFIAVAGGVSGVIILFARGSRSAEAIGLAGGLLFGVADALFNALVGVFQHHGVPGLLESPWTWACVAASIAAFAAFQTALQRGRGKSLGVVALMTAGTNVTAVGAGFIVFGDRLGSSGLWSAVHVGCFVAVGVAAWWLAPAQVVVEVGARPGGAVGVTDPDVG